MNQPTREEFERLKEQVKRIEQQTEPINVRIERGLPVPEANLLQTIMGMVGTQATDVALLKGSMEGVKADIKAIRESQADQRDRIKELKDAMATKEDIAAVKDDVGRLEKIMLQMLDRMPQQEGE